MDSLPATPRLRLVRPEGRAAPSVHLAEPASGTDQGVAAARRAVRHENLSASALSASDARWIFAVRVSQLLTDAPSGINVGRSVLPPANRERLQRLAQRVGLRPFDANLIIAIVQDGARSGEGPLGPNVADRLSYVRPAGPDRAVRSAWRSFLATLALAIALAGVLVFAFIRWLQAGS